MTALEIRDAFLALPDHDKSRAVAMLGHNLTICARAAYPGQVRDELAAPKLRTFNELQHSVTAKLIQNGNEAFPDDAFLDVLFEKARHGDCEKELVWALTKAVECIPQQVR